MAKKKSDDKRIHSIGAIPAVSSYLRRIGAEIRSFRTAVIKEEKGKYWRDIAIIRITRDGKVEAPEAFAPSEEEAKKIEVEVKGVIFPSHQPMLKYDLPPELAKLSKSAIFEFKDEHGRMVMIQARHEKRDGGKAYYPWTYWDDEMWRQMEPEGPLPLWGIDQLKDNAIVFIHEGAKAARFVREMVEAKTFAGQQKLAAHPWGQELSNAAHIGWIGGALSPSRTDWSVINKSGAIKAYIVSDNDKEGRRAVKEISRALRLPTWHLQFTEEWPTSFDLADPFPDKMFHEVGGNSYYTGPAFLDCIHPATYATDLIPNGKGKPTPVLREHFKEQWAYIEEADLFVCVDMPSILRSKQIADNVLAAFSDTKLTTDLILKAYHGRTVRLAYRPDIPARTITDAGNGSAINLHLPTTIRAAQGDPTPFLDFLEYLFVSQSDIEEVKRWIATLIACPEVRMEYGLLLVSEAQGMGKTTLGARILAPLVGIRNASFPSEADITHGQFNGWLANKRLVVVSEIYAGQSWKAYNVLKSAVTDRDVYVNEKYMRPYRVENWAHIIACSNSMRALKMEQDDRRWFYPQMNEVPWPRDKFAELHAWLAGGGLSIIRKWAEDFEGEYVKQGDRAPMTKMKEEMIAESRSEAQHAVHELGAALAAMPQPIAVAMKDVVQWVRAIVKSRGEERIYDTDYELRKAMKSAGVFVHEDRIKIGGWLQHVILNRAAVNLIASLPASKSDKSSIAGLLREIIRPSAELIAGEM